MHVRDILFWRGSCLVPSGPNFDQSHGAFQAFGDGDDDTTTQVMKWLKSKQFWGVPYNLVIEVTLPSTNHCSVRSVFIGLRHCQALLNVTRYSGCNEVRISQILYRIDYSVWNIIADYTQSISYIALVNETQ